MSLAIVQQHQLELDLNVIPESQPLFRRRAAKGKGLKAKIPLENPGRQHLLYGVLESDLPPNWLKNLQALKSFCNVISPEEENRLVRERGRQDKKKGMREVSFQNYQHYLLAYLGWISKFWIDPKTGNPYDLSEVSVDMILDPDCLKSYLLWHQEDRKNSTACFIIFAIW